MNILLAHFRVGETDGVSLEMDKWKWALEALGHKVFYLAGSSGSCSADLVPELHYLEPFNDKIIQNAYVKRTDYESESVLIEAIEQRAEQISTGVVDVIRQRNIDVVVPNNIWSLGYHLPAALGLMKAIEATNTQVICHHHDFHWERVKYSNPTSESIAYLLATIFPPKHPLVKHCVINRIAQNELHKRRDIDSTVVPNVFDFHSNDWKVDEYNHDLRSRFDIRPDDVMFLQATRIVARKGIELAIDLINQIAKKRECLEGKILYNGQVFTDKSRLILTFAGMCEEEDYFRLLQEKAQNKGVELRVISDWVGHSRDVKDGHKVYSLWDVYSHADIITYPSLLEGWGNQFLEGLVAKVPMVVYRYPVYDLDIADQQFSIIDLGNTHTVDEQGLACIDEQKLNSAANETLSYLTDESSRFNDMNRNYAIGEKNYSYPALKAILSQVFTQL